MKNLLFIFAIGLCLFTSSCNKDTCASEDFVGTYSGQDCDGEDFTFDVTANGSTITLTDDGFGLPFILDDCVATLASVEFFGTTIDGTMTLEDTDLIISLTYTEEDGSAETCVFTSSK